MTKNEQVKQSINNNMDSIYTALEQVGAPLPEQKNLQNVAPAIKSAFNGNELAENIAYVKQMDMLESITTATKVDTSDYTNEKIQYLESILIALTEDNNGKI